MQHPLGWHPCHAELLHAVWPAAALSQLLLWLPAICEGMTCAAVACRRTASTAGSGSGCSPCLCWTPSLHTCRRRSCWRSGVRMYAHCWTNVVDNAHAAVYSVRLYSDLCVATYACITWLADGAPPGKAWSSNLAAAAERRVQSPSRAPGHHPDHDVQEGARP